MAFFAEEFFEHVAEVDADLGEGLGEAALGLLVDALDDGEEFGFGGDEVVVLIAEEVVAFFEFVVFLDGVDVDRAHGFDLTLEILDEDFDVVPVRFARHVGDVVRVC